jgi:hypothetical protein
VLLLTELGADVVAVTPTIRRVAPAAESILVVAFAPRRGFAWFSGAVPGDFDESVQAAADTLRLSLAGAAPHVEVVLAAGLDPEGLEATATERGIDLLVGAWSLPPSALTAIAAVRKRGSLAVLWVARATASDRPIREIRCEALGRRALAAVAGFLRDHGDAGMHVTIVQLEPRVRDLDAALGVAGIEAQVELVTPAIPFRGTFDLLVLARFPGALLRATSIVTPVLILPPVAPGASDAQRSPGTVAIRRAIDTADLVADGDVMRACLHYASGVGRIDPIPDQEVAFVSGGRIAAVIATVNGIGELSTGIAGESFGVFRVTARPGLDPLEAVEVLAAVIRPGPRALVLFDSEISDRELTALAAVGQRDDGPELLAVRMRPTRSCESIRSRLRRAGLPTRVADASAVLDEGTAFDVPEAVDAVRLARVGARMHAAGFAVAAFVHRAKRAPRAIGIAALRPEEVGAGRWPHAPGTGPRTLASRLQATTGARLIAGNRVEVEMDNAKARRWLLEAIAGSRERVHLQLYMAEDDDVGARVEAALGAAGARGVAVRVVVDSLHGLEGSFGAHNPLLARLRARPGVELLVSQPITGVPTLEAIKQRDHRKLAIVDGSVALVGGRNLSHEYYTGFDEVRLDPTSLWREVPWLDAGARAEGPVVAELERSFLDAWQVAGGAPFAIAEQPAVGSTAVRVVVHHGLRDAWTLEAYLALIESATSHVYAVNGFPPDPRDSARAAARDPARRTGMHTLRQSHAHARWDAIRRAVVVRPVGVHGNGAFAHG